MNLPEIPRDALDAAGAGRSPESAIAAILRDAWPHLYAAALRHAADELVREYGPRVWSEEGLLLRMADEASPR